MSKKLVISFVVPAFLIRISRLWLSNKTDFLSLSNVDLLGGGGGGDLFILIRYSYAGEATIVFWSLFQPLIGQPRLLCRRRRRSTTEYTRFHQASHSSHPTGCCRASRPEFSRFRRRRRRRHRRRLPSRKE